MENIKYSDNINNLPTSEYQPSYNELNIMNSLFQEKNSNNLGKIVSEFKDVAIIGGVFAIFSTSFTDTFIEKFVPFTKKSPYYTIAFKTLIFIIIVWLIQNKHLFFKN